MDDEKFNLVNEEEVEEDTPDLNDVIGELVF